MGRCPTPAPFVDTIDSLFAEDIAAVAAAGITLGCNPPDRDRYCPDSEMTRGQLAAMLVRSLALPMMGERASAPDARQASTDPGMRRTFPVVARPSSALCAAAASPSG